MADGLRPTGAVRVRPRRTAPADIPNASTATMQKAHRNGRALVGSIAVWLSSPVPHTPTIVELPEDHFPGRGMHHPNLPATGHCARLGGHRHRQGAVVHHDLVGCCSRIPACPMRALQGPIAFNAEVVDSLVFDVYNSCFPVSFLK